MGSDTQRKFRWTEAGGVISSRSLGCSRILSDSIPNSIQTPSLPGVVVAWGTTLASASYSRLRWFENMPVKIPQALSIGEETMALHFRIERIEVVREYVFAPPRKFRFDFCIIDKKIAIEVDGGSRSHGRHNRADGFAADCEKLNLAAALGWRVFRFTTNMVVSGKAIQTIREVLA